MCTHKITVQIFFVFTLIAIVLGVFSYRNDVDNKVENPIAVDEIGTEYEEGKIYDMPSNLMFTSDVEETADNSGITLKATVKPSGAYDKALIWSVKWKNSADSFATDNPDVTKFVTVTSKSSDTAEVVCLKPFGSQIEVIATSVSNTNAKATCTLDYVEKITGFMFEIGGKDNSQSQSSYNVLDNFLCIFGDDKIQQHSFIPYDKSSGDYAAGIICNISMTTLAWSKNPHTLDDWIETFNLSFSVSDMVKEYYMNTGGYAYTQIHFRNGEQYSNAWFDYLGVFSYPALMGLTDKHNALMSFLKKHLGEPMMVCNYDITTRMGVQYQGQFLYTFTSESLVTA